MPFAVVQNEGSGMVKAKGGEWTDVAVSSIYENILRLTVPFEVVEGLEVKIEDILILPGYGLEDWDMKVKIDVEINGLKAIQSNAFGKLTVAPPTLLNTSLELLPSSTGPLIAYWASPVELWRNDRVIFDFSGITEVDFGSATHFSYNLT